MPVLMDRPEVEYLDGRSYPKVSPRAMHAFVQGAVVRLLYELGSKRGKCGPELRCKIGAADGTRTLFVPDVSFVSNERWYALPPEAREEPPFAPDVAVEIRSPRENAGFRKRKIERYLKTGAVLVLDVDPQSRTVAAHTAQGMRTFHEGDRFACGELPWLAFGVARVFADLD